MQLFSGRHWLPLNQTIYADGKRDLSQLDLNDRILSAFFFFSIQVKEIKTTTLF